jgi:hypothetical protein
MTPERWRRLARFLSYYVLARTCFELMDWWGNTWGILAAMGLSLVVIPLLELTPIKDDVPK